MRRVTRPSATSKHLGGNSSEPGQAIWDQTVADLQWAFNDPELQRRFEGEFIVVRERTVLSHGHDRMEALQQAMGAGYPREELVVVPMLALAAETPPDAI